MQCASQEILSAEPIRIEDTEEQQQSEGESLHDQNVMLDWKGDPMVVNPGDRLPFNFR